MVWKSEKATCLPQICSRRTHVAHYLNYLHTAIHSPVCGACCVCLGSAVASFAVCTLSPVSRLNGTTTSHAHRKYGAHIGTCFPHYVQPLSLSANEPPIIIIIIITIVFISFRRRSSSTSIEFHTHNTRRKTSVSHRCACRSITGTHAKHYCGMPMHVACCWGQIGRGAHLDGVYCVLCVCVYLCVCARKTLTNRSKVIW